MSKATLSSPYMSSLHGQGRHHCFFATLMVKTIANEPLTPLSYKECHLHETEVFTNDIHMFGLHFMRCRVLMRSHD